MSTSSPLITPETVTITDGLTTAQVDYAFDKMVGEYYDEAGITMPTGDQAPVTDGHRLTAESRLQPGAFVSAGSVVKNG